MTSTVLSCIPEPGKSCQTPATFHVWFESCAGVYTSMCDEHAASAVARGVNGYRVAQIKTIKAATPPPDARVTAVTEPGGIDVQPEHDGKLEEDFQHFLSYSGLGIYSGPGISQPPAVISLLRQAYAAAWEPDPGEALVKANQRIANLESAIITHFLVTAIPISSMRRTELALYDLVSYRLNEGAGKEVKGG